MQEEEGEGEEGEDDYEEEGGERPWEYLASN